MSWQNFVVVGLVWWGMGALGLIGMHIGSNRLWLPEEPQLMGDEVLDSLLWGWIGPVACLGALGFLMHELLYNFWRNFSERELLPPVRRKRSSW